MGVERTCGDWSVLSERELSQSDVCKTTQNDLFDRCCFKQCSLCDEGWAVNWNHPLTFNGLASTCLDVFMNLRNEGVQDGHDRCLSVRFTVSHECCYKMPTNQCSLCQASNGTFLNTNWNAEVVYQGQVASCGDVNALLSSEEIDSILCLSARDDFWNQCCTPQQGGNTGLGGILPIVPEASDSTTPSNTGSGEDGTSFSSNTYFRRPSGTQYPRSLDSLILATLVLFFIMH